MLRTVERVALLTCLVVGGSAVSAAQPTELPIVRLVATGGTISNRPGGRLTAQQLVDSVPGLDQHVRAETEQFDNVSSSSLSLTQWVALSQRLNQLFDERPELDGIVVTSGTDTLEETAYFLHLTVRSDRPVVVVGSMRPPQTLGYDGSANLLQGFRVAAEPASRGQGVLVVLNSQINSAREVTKTDAQRLQTFDSRGYGLLGVVDSDRVVYYRRTLHRHTLRSEFDIRAIDSLPRVDVLLTYQDAPGDLIDAAVELGATGLVVAGAGAGATSPSQREAIATATDRGIPIVVTTRTGGGRVLPRRSNSGQGVDTQPRTSTRIVGEDLSPVKARVLLMLALTRTADRDEIQRMFSEY